jgi:DNA polymerase I-like protein with 3'-5' exonuclease and polymerase domains
MITYIDGSDSASLDLSIKFLSELKLFGLDTETTGLDPHGSKVLLISAGNETQQFVFDVAKLGNRIMRLKPLIESTDIVKLLQNAKFDYKMLKVNLGITVENIYDTMLAEKLLLMGRKKSGFGLDDLTEKYCRISIDKSLQSSFADMKFGDSFTPEQIEYSGGDIQYLEAIFSKQHDMLRKHNMEDLAMLEMDSCLAVGDMEVNGMYIDSAAWMLTYNTTDIAKLTARQRLDAIFKQYIPVDMFGNPEINYNSNPQLLAALKLILPPKEALKLKNTKADTLQAIYSPAIDALLDYRNAEKRVSTYGQQFLTDNVSPFTGRIHSTFDQLGTDTGRFASKNP